MDGRREDCPAYCTARTFARARPTRGKRRTRNAHPRGCPLLSKQVRRPGRFTSRGGERRTRNARPEGRVPASNRSPVPAGFTLRGGKRRSRSPHRRRCAPLSRRARPLGRFAFRWQAAGVSIPVRRFWRPASLPKGSLWCLGRTSAPRAWQEITEPRQLSKRERGVKRHLVAGQARLAPEPPVERRGLEPRLTDCQPVVLPVGRPPHCGSTPSAFRTFWGPVPARPSAGGDQAASEGRKGTPVATRGWCCVCGTMGTRTPICAMRTRRPPGWTMAPCRGERGS